LETVARRNQSPQINRGDVNAVTALLSADAVVHIEAALLAGNRGRFSPLWSRCSGHYPELVRPAMTNVVLWNVQIFLALFFLGAAFPKLTGRGLERWRGFSNLPRGLVLDIGTGEVLGSVGLVLPMATGILPWLTPLAAIGLAINVLMAAGFHVRGNEWLNAIVTTLWAAIAGIIATGRWNLIDQTRWRFRRARWLRLWRCSCRRRSSL
jgi:hypothetical protein